MKGKTKEILEATEAVSERTAETTPKTVSEQTIPVKAEPTPAIGEIGFDVLPSEMVSIVAGNRLLLLQDGVVEITVKYKTKE